MNPTWLPTSKVTFRQASAFPVGSIILGVTPHKAAPIAFAVRSDHLRRDGTTVQMLLTLTQWYGGRTHVGDLFRVSTDHRYAGFEPEPCALSLEVDTSAPTIGNTDGGGYAALGNLGFALAGWMGRHEQQPGAGRLLIDPRTWMTINETQAGELVYFDAWRLRLRLDERENVFFGGRAD